MFRNPLAAGAGALPAEASSFIGRQHDVAQARRQLESQGFVTLLGPAGVGKSRLAVRIAHHMHDDFPGGVVFVELVGVTTARHLVDTVSTAVGAQSSNGDTATALLGHLRHQMALIVLDNCEHLVEPVADLASALRRECPRVSLLATSREALRLEGEIVQIVAPFAKGATGNDALAMRNAVDLFVDRARPFIREPVTTTDETMITHICDQVGGLALAIEFVANRCTVLSLKQLRDELRNPLNIATRGRRREDPRHHTLRAAIQWSYDLCTRDEQEAWRYLSVFNSPWDLAAGAALLDRVTNGNVSAADTHQALLEKSIIQRIERPGLARYCLLAPMREFGREKLTRTESVKIHQAYREEYTRLAGRTSVTGRLALDTAALMDPTETDSSRHRIAPEALTNREAEVADLVVLGLSDREIAKRLTVSIRTINGHVQHILTKLALTSRTQVAVWRTLHPRAATPNAITGTPP